MPYERLLLATDFSEPSELAAEVARRIGANARVDVLTVAPGTRTSSALAEMTPAAVLYPDYEDLAQLRAQLVEWARERGLVASETLLRIGTASDEIVREAKARGAELVVLGARGHSRVDELMLGSTAKDVVNHARSDVLIVRDGVQASGPPFARLVVATDFSESSKRATTTAAALAKEWSVPVTLLHVISSNPLMTALTDASSPFEARARLDQINEKRFGGRARCLVREGSPSDQVGLALETQKDVLLVIGNRGAGMLERLMLGSTANSLVERAPSSVLLVKETG